MPHIKLLNYVGFATEPAAKGGVRTLIKGMAMTPVRRLGRISSAPAQTVIGERESSDALVILR
jgi:hypothetical protein